MGFFELSIQNTLVVASEVVPLAVPLLIFVRLENLRVYDLKPQPLAVFGVGYAVGVQIAADEMVAEGGDPIVSDVDVGGDTDTPTVIANTADQSNVQSVIPCKLEIGRKYEYCIADIHDLVRRYVFYPVGRLSSTTVTDLYNLNTYQVVTIPVQFYSPLDKLYMGWSGHIKLRIFVYDTKPGMVMYQPTASSASSAFADNSAQFMVQDGYTPASWGGAFVNTNSSTISFGAREMMYPVSTNCSMIDISVPFDTQFNFLPTGTRVSETNDPTSNTGNGNVLLRCSTTATYEIWVSGGDDFRYHIWCPAAGMGFIPYFYSSGVKPDGTGASLGGNFL